MLYAYDGNLALGGLMVKGKELECVGAYTYLGITLDSNTSFKKELNKTISKVNHKMWMLSHFRSC